MNDKVKLNGSTIKRISKNIIFFILSKGAAFFAPIFFVKLVSLRDYGVIEFSYSFGSIFAVFLTLGLGGAFPYFILKKEDYEKEQLFYFHSFYIIFIWAISSIIYYLGVISTTIYLPISFSVIFSLERLYSSILKSKDRGYLAVMLDGGYYFLLSILIIISFFKAIDNYIGILIVLMNIFTLFLSSFYIINYIKYKTVSIKELIYSYYPPVLAFSCHLILSSILIYFLTTSPRIYIKYLLGFDDVGIYSFYFRLAGIAVVIYMFLSITFFKKLYLSNPKTLDKYFAIILIVVLTIGLIFNMVTPFVIDYFLPNQRSDPQNGNLLFLLSFQMPLWVGISLNEGILSRENLVKRMNIFLFVIVMLIPITLFLTRSLINLESFTMIYITFFSIAHITQILILREKNIFFSRTLSYTIISFVVSLSIFLFN